MSEVFDIPILVIPAQAPARLMAYRPFGTFRLLLASLVVFQHFTANAAPDPLHTFALGLSPGSSAVLVFFALSGFVIAEAVERFYLGKPFAFLGNRMLRIVPHFVLAMTISVAVHYAFFSAGSLRDARDYVFTPAYAAAFSPTALVANIVAFLPIPVRRWAPVDFLNVAWAIRVEMMFYFAVFAALLAGGLLRLSRRALLCTMAACAAVIYASALFGLVPAKVGLVAYFAFGYALYIALTGSRAARWLVLCCLPAIQLNFLQHPIYTDQDGISFNYTFDGLLAAGLLLAMIMLSGANLSRLRGLDQALGEITFPLYMYHMPVLVMVMSVTQGYSMPAYLGGMALSVLVSYGMSRLIDPRVARLWDRLRGKTLSRALQG